MLSGDLTATRDDPFDPSAASKAPAFTRAPERLFAAPTGEPRSERLKRIVPSISVSVMFHAGLAVAFVVLWGSMVEDLTAPEPISVEIVKSVPGDGAKKPEAQQGTPKTDPTPPPGAPPRPDPLAQALPAPAQAQAQSAAPPAPAGSALAPATASRAPAGQPPAQAEQRSAQDAKQPGPTPKPDLIEPPPEPKRAATQDEKNQKANVAKDELKDSLPPGPAAEAPQVITAPEAESSITPAAPKPDVAKPTKPSDPDQSSKDATAMLAAALPMSPTLALPPTFRAMLSSAGSAESQEYKGSVYGVLGRIKQVGARASQMGMKQGQVGLMISIGPNGTIDKIAVMQSSGRADVDAMVVDMVRSAGPFPPPPPGADRTFTPMISFGEQ